MTSAETTPLSRIIQSLESLPASSTPCDLSSSMPGEAVSVRGSGEGLAHGEGELAAVHLALLGVEYVGVGRNAFAGLNEASRDVAPDAKQRPIEPGLETEEEHARGVRQRLDRLELRLARRQRRSARRIFVEHQEEKLRARQDIDDQRDVVLHCALELPFEQAHPHVVARTLQADGPVVAQDAGAV